MNPGKNSSRGGKQSGGGGRQSPDGQLVMYSVSQRARELGIRVALGASRSDIARLVMGHGIRFVLSTMLFGLAGTDAVTYGQVAVVVAAVSVLACAVPTARSGRLVTSVLRAE